MCEQRIPSVVLAHESFAFYLYFGCYITLYGEVSSTDGKVLPREIRCRHPNFSAEEVTFLLKAKNTSAPKQSLAHPKKRNSHHITSNEQLKICLSVGGCVVGTALVESGFGRETPFSVERGLSPKVFLLQKFFSISTLPERPRHRGSGS